MSAPREGFPSLQRVVLAEPQTGEAIQILALELYGDGFAFVGGATERAVRLAGLSPAQGR
jgi:hypothetical protein